MADLGDTQVKETGNTTAKGYCEPCAPSPPIHNPGQSLTQATFL